VIIEWPNETVITLYCIKHPENGYRTLGKYTDRYQKIKIWNSFQDVERHIEKRPLDSEERILELIAKASGRQWQYGEIPDR